jgi:hypothetical protein
MQWKIGIFLPDSPHPNPLPKGEGTILRAASPWRIAGVVLSTIFCALCGSTFAKDEPKAAPQIGRFVHVGLPITGQTGARLLREVRLEVDKAKRQNARLVLVVQFDVPKGQKNFGRGSDFGAAYSLANFLSSDELGGVRTVAYLPDSVEGHAVLAAVACQEIIMAPDATIGAAGIDEQTITAPHAERIRRDCRPAADPADPVGIGNARSVAQSPSSRDGGWRPIRDARWITGTETSTGDQGAGRGKGRR